MTVHFSSFIKAVAFGAAVALSGLSNAASAATVSFSTFVTGEDIGSVEVAKLDAVQDGSSVLFTLTDTLLSHATSYIDYLRLNYTGALPTAWANVSGVPVSLAQSGTSTDASYTFNLKFNWSNSNRNSGLLRLNPGESSTFRVLGVDLALFDFSPFKTMVHVNALNSGGSTKYTGGNELPPVPLPAAGWLMAVGLGGLVAMRKRKSA